MAPLDDEFLLVLKKYLSMCQCPNAHKWVRSYPSTAHQTIWYKGTGAAAQLQQLLIRILMWRLLCFVRHVRMFFSMSRSFQFLTYKIWTWFCIWNQMVTCIYFIIWTCVLLSTYIWYHDHDIWYWIQRWISTTIKVWSFPRYDITTTHVKCALLEKKRYY